MSDPYTEWEVGVLRGISAPFTAANADTLWAWSGAESGTDRMRINNPLNTTQPEGAGNVDFNSVGVKEYPTVEQGIAATVTTLLNGYYSIIVNHLRNSVPRQQWGDACAELGIWGTGCGWIGRDYGAAPGVITQPSRRRTRTIATSDSFIVFAIGDDDALWCDRFDNTKGAWTGAVKLGGSISDFDVTGSGQRIDVYARGVADRQIYHLHSSDAGLTFSGFEATGGGTYKSPVVALGPGPVTPPPAPATDLSALTAKVDALAGLVLRIETALKGA